MTIPHVGGRPLGKRGQWCETLGLSKGQKKHLSGAVLAQLDNCQDESARRLLTGKGVKADENVGERMVLVQSEPR